MSATAATSSSGGRTILLLCAAGGVIAFARAWEHREREQFFQLTEERRAIGMASAATATALGTLWNDSLAHFSLAPRRGELPTLLLIGALEDLGRESGAEITAISIVSDSVIPSGGGLVALRFSARGSSASAMRLLRLVEEHRPLLRIADLSITQLNPMPRPGEPDELVLEGRVEAMARPADPSKEGSHD